MGVHGLWRLIEPSGKPVPLETLENKILAVDISIWLHQAIKGFQDSRGASLPNAHLLSVFHRLCKLLYFRIKPVFVFDGGVPVLKKQTINKRNQQKAKLLNEANDKQTKLLKILLKQTALDTVLDDDKTKNKLIFEKAKEKEEDDIYKLPELPESSELHSTLEANSSDDELNHHYKKQWNLHTIDEKSESFKSLPADVRHELLTKVKETRKQSSWNRLHELPTESNEFSSFQMKRLLKRSSIQTSLEDAEKEMGGHSLSLGELESLMNEKGIITKENVGQRIASNENARFLLIKSLEEAIKIAKENSNKIPKGNDLDKQNEIKINENIDEQIEKCFTNTNQVTISNEIIFKDTENVLQNHESEDEDLLNDREYQRDLATAISLSLQDQPSTSKATDISFTPSIIDSSDSDIENESSLSNNNLFSSVKSYMTEYSELTSNEIAKLLNGNCKKSKGLKTKNFKSKVMLDKVERSGEGKIDLDSDKIMPSNSGKIDETDKTNKTLEEHLQQNTKIETANEKLANVITIINNTKDTTNKIDSDAENNESDKINQNKDIESFDEIKKLKDTKNVEKEMEVTNMSDSDDSDFIEVSCPKTDVKFFEIIINTGDKMQDDIFEDIFKSSKESDIVEVSNLPETTKENGNIQNICENKLKLNGNATIDMNTDECVTSFSEKNKCVQEIVENKTIPEKIIPSKEDIIIQPSKDLITLKELEDIRSNLATEQQQLVIDQNSKVRMATNITDQMYQETQELLELFGVPYVIAPMEAEAQCAFLNDIKLADGIITDDSDVWLFGGKTVYKNFFNNNKHVMEFRAEAIENYFKMNREQLILMALLVGSDYTIGIQGIGPVTALEILAAFPPKKSINLSVFNQDDLITGLLNFRKWLLNNQAVGLSGLRRKLQNVKLSDGFPNLQVIEAYLQPKVDTCSDKFSWAPPDMEGLIEFAREKFGWTRMKSEEILSPVLRKLEERNIQKSIRDYFNVQYKFNENAKDVKLSNRVKRALQRMTNSENNDTENVDTKTKKTNRNKKIKTVETTESSETLVSKVKSKKIKNVERIEISTEDTIQKIKALEVLQLPSTSKLPITPKITNIANEIIPQREADKRNALRNKLHAIEVFRKSKLGHVKKRPKKIIPIKEDVELSESSTSSD